MNNNYCVNENLTLMKYNEILDVSSMCSLQGNLVVEFLKTVLRGSRNLILPYS